MRRSAPIALPPWCIPALLALVAGAGSGCGRLFAQCEGNDDCGDAEVCIDGQCQMRAARDAGTTTSSSSGSVTTWDGGEFPDAGSPGQVCPHNQDFTLTSEELPLAIGVVSRFVAASPDGGVDVDLAGTVVDGGRVWRFDAPLRGDHQLEVAAQPIANQWYASRFPDGGYVVPIDGEARHVGVFRRTANAILLVGAASTHPDDTLLDYDPPITVTPLPVSLGDVFSSTTHNSGTFEGTSFYSSNDTYETTVDAAGAVVTPAGWFPALRMRTVQTVKVPMLVWPFELDYRYVRYSFMTPCYGQVVSVASFEGEEQTLFTKAADVRRLGLLP